MAKVTGWLVLTFVPVVLGICPRSCQPGSNFNIVTTANRTCKTEVVITDGNPLNLSCVRCDGKPAVPYWFQGENVISLASNSVLADGQIVEFSCGDRQERKGRAYTQVRVCGPPLQPTLACLLIYRSGFIFNCSITTINQSNYCGSQITRPVKIQHFISSTTLKTLLKNENALAVNLCFKEEPCRRIYPHVDEQLCLSGQSCHVHFNDAYIFKLMIDYQLIFNVSVVSTLDGLQFGASRNFELVSEQIQHYYKISDQLNEVHHAPREVSFQIPETHRPTHPKLEGSYVCNVTLFSLPTRYQVKSFGYSCFLDGFPLRLTGLGPARQYQLIVSYKMINSSLWTGPVTRNFTTKPDVPQWPLKYALRSYVIQQCDVEMILPEFSADHWNGPDGQIFVEIANSSKRFPVSPLSGPQSVTSGPFMVKINVEPLLCGQDFQVILIAQNREGKSSPLRQTIRWTQHVEDSAQNQGWQRLLQLIWVGVSLCTVLLFIALAIWVRRIYQKEKPPSLPPRSYLTPFQSLLQPHQQINPRRFSDDHTYSATEGIYFEADSSSEDLISPATEAIYFGPNSSAGSQPDSFYQSPTMLY